ncbi:C-4 sterol methyl oxidase [Globomyces sp. JEL0801]|nr:C-4 sterol methyl oxidase [Globomyces sp. JEL0801]
MNLIIPYSLIEYIPYFDQFKLQPNRSLTRQDWKKLILHSLLARAFTGIIYPVTVFLQLSTSSTFPDLPDIVSQIALFVVIEDFVYYWCHRALHWGPLYKHIHKMHHEYTFNRAIVAEYAHTVEALTVAFGFFMGK